MGTRVLRILRIKMDFLVALRPLILITNGLKLPLAERRSNQLFMNAKQEFTINHFHFFHAYALSLYPPKAVLIRL